MGKEKGNAYERELCVKFSKWWTDGARDDLFYRTQGSGGRATRRGRTTAGCEGDIMCMDPDGHAFTATFSIEAKNGYGSEWSVQDVLEKSPRSAKQLFEEFWEQATKAADLSGKQPLLIFKKNRRQDILCIRYIDAAGLDLLDGIDASVPHLIFVRDREAIVMLQLNTFLELVTRQHVEKAYELKQRSQ